MPRKSEKSLPGPPAPGSQKVWKKSQKRSRKDIFETFSRLFGLFGDFFQTFWAPGTFSDFFGIPGPEGPRDSCSSREGSQLQSQGTQGARARHNTEIPPMIISIVKPTVVQSYRAWGQNLGNLEFQSTWRGSQPGVTMPLSLAANTKLTLSLRGVFLVDFLSLLYLEKAWRNNLT